jgi:hypothetical protein
MSVVLPGRSVVKSRVLLITWLLALGLALYLVENLWVDRWIRARFVGLPSLVPEALTPAWFVMFGLGGIVCVVLVVCLVLVARHGRVSVRVKVCTGIAVVGACVLWGVWFRATNGTTHGATSAAAAGQHKHSVTLNWKASTSPVVGYNVYRSTVKGRDYARINLALVTGTSYKDETVESRTTYYYMARAVDAKGNESLNSAEVVARVP